MAGSADQLIESEYAQLQSEVQRTVAAKLNAGGIKLSSHDIEGAYNEAWHALYMAIQEGQEIENRTGYLVTVAYRRALKEFEASKWTRRSDADIDQLETSLDIDSQLDAEMQIRHVEEGFRSKLSERELQAASLCLIHGYTRPEAAKLLGISPKRMEKVMDKASGKISGVVESVRGGTHCEELNSTIKAFALGLLDSEGERYRLASDHLEGCPACRREVWTVRGLAAVAPPIPIAFALLTAGAGAGAGGSTATGGAGAAQSGSAASAGGSTSGGSAASGAAGPQTAVVGAVVAAVAVAGLVVAGLATGFIGTPGGSGGDDSPTTASSQESSSATSASAAAAKAAAQARRQQARAAAKRKARKARAKAKAARAKKARAAEAAAIAAAEAESSYEPVEEVYVPPPPPPAPVIVEPEPQPEPPKPRPEKPKPEPRPTTDADEEFGVVRN